MHIKYHFPEKIPQCLIFVRQAGILSWLPSTGYYQKLDFITDRSDAFSWSKENPKISMKGSKPEKNDMYGHCFSCGTDLEWMFFILAFWPSSWWKTHRAVNVKVKWCWHCRWINQQTGTHNHCKHFYRYQCLTPAGMKLNMRHFSTFQVKLV